MTVALASHDDLPTLLADGRAPETREGLIDRLTALGIETRTVEHEAAFTVEASQHLHRDLPGIHVKNLFLKPKFPGPFLLLVLEAHRKVSVNALTRSLGIPRTSFASPADLMLQLGVTPGSVTPFAMVNAAPGSVTVALDPMLVEEGAIIQAHPLVNTASTMIASADMLRFLRGLGHEPLVLSPEVMAPPAA
ncbi:prolyl-tRNA synthetase associated domain-containing protein [Acetobacteraceae bacterium H6797]|nr:prolyl-tRNA synthetase associated domain-containing protein [Acetobacteraceae bacterium H6797]